MLEIYEKELAELKQDMIGLGMKVEQAVETRGRPWNAKMSNWLSVSSMAMMPSMNWSNRA